MDDRTMEIEMGAGIEPIDELIAQHRKHRERHAVLWAKYGPGGVADNLRKVELSRIKENIRAMAAATGAKVTEAALEDAAHAHNDYFAMVSLMQVERQEFSEVDAKLREIEWRFNRGQGLLRYAANEPR